MENMENIEKMEKGDNRTVTERYFDWDPHRDPEFRPLLCGEGSIGGKGRSLLFAIRKLRDSADPLLQRTILPRSRYFAVSVFRRFLEGVGDLDCLRAQGNPEALEAAFLATPLPQEVTDTLSAFLADMDDPVVVRSSSVLEDSVQHSFAGKYLSTFLSNSPSSLAARVAAVERQIKTIYSHTFFPKAVLYRAKHHLGEDEMGIIVMRMSGRWRGRYYYPTMGGVGYSKNFRRWTTRIRTEDGVLRVVFGLGTMSTKRGYARVFSLSNPFLRPEGQNPEKIAFHAQERFHAIDRESPDELTEVRIAGCWKQILASHPDFATAFAQVYQSEPEGGYFNALSPTTMGLDSVNRICITFEHFPRRYAVFFERMKKTLSLLEAQMGVPADIEFTYEPISDSLELIQSRPLWSAACPVEDIPEDCLEHRRILQADRMVTHGCLRDIRNVVYVDHKQYGRGVDAYEVARAIGRLNQEFRARGGHYIFVAPGRVGSSAPELGVPVQYNELTNCCCIVELGIPKLGYMPELSYGTHFFTDLEVDNVLYMPVFDGERHNLYDEEWFNDAPYEVGSHPAIRIYRGHFSVYMDGEQNFGVVVVDAIE